MIEQIRVAAGGLNPMIGERFGLDDPFMNIPMIGPGNRDLYLNRYGQPGALQRDRENIELAQYDNGQYNMQLRQVLG